MVCIIWTYHEDYTDLRKIFKDILKAKALGAFFAARHAQQKIWQPLANPTAKNILYQLLFNNKSLHFLRALRYDDLARDTIII